MPFVADTINVTEDLIGDTLESVLSVLEFLLPPLASYLRWDVGDIGPIIPVSCIFPLKIGVNASHSVFTTGMVRRLRSNQGRHAREEPLAGARCLSYLHICLSVYQ